MGRPIHCLDRVPEDVQVFHAGTREENGHLVTAGGRVLTIVGGGATFEDAIARAYAGVSQVSFEGMHYRRDIGRKALRMPDWGMRSGADF
jgi:phosphoribosylamine---glycine ligase